MLEVRELTKRFAGVHVLQGVSFRVMPGEIVGYLGPNGSGKSTTFKILAGLLDPTAGGVWLDGQPTADHPTAFRRQLGYVPEEPYLYGHLTAPEYLQLVGALRGLSPTRLHRQIEGVLELLDLASASGAVMTTFSKGMRQRVLLASALLHDPALLVLDEPFSALDVNASLLLVAMIEALARRGKMILLSSHRMDVVETLCPRILILHRGRIVAEGPPRELRSTCGMETLDEVFALVTEQQDYSARAEALLDLVQ